MSQASNIRWRAAALLRGRTELAVLLVWAAMFGCGVAESLSEGPTSVSEPGVQPVAQWAPPSVVSRSQPPPATIPKPAIVAKYVFSKGPPVIPAKEVVVAEPVAPVAPAVPAITAPKVLPDKLRDPFWPVDYVVPVQHIEKVVAMPDVKIQESEWREAEAALRGMAKNWGRMPGKNGDDRYFVLIGGKSCEIGDTVSLAADGKTYRWRVTGISRQNGPVFERIAPTSAAPQVKP